MKLALKWASTLVCMFGAGVCMYYAYKVLGTRDAWLWMGASWGFASRVNDHLGTPQ